MNNARRKQISSIDTNAIRAKAEELRALIENAVETATAAKDEEEEYRDNMPESLQGGEKYENASEAVDALDTFISALEGIEFDDLTSACDDLDGHSF
jgi:hypothetical protein